jgi:hypothetical protein
MLSFHLKTIFRNVQNFIVNPQVVLPFLPCPYPALVACIEVKRIRFHLTLAPYIWAQSQHILFRSAFHTKKNSGQFLDFTFILFLALKSTSTSFREMCRLRRAQSKYQGNCSVDQWWAKWRLSTFDLYPWGKGHGVQGQIYDFLRPQLAMNPFLPLWTHRFPHFGYIHLGGGGVGGSDIWSMSSIRPICKCRCPPLLLIQYFKPVCVCSIRVWPPPPHPPKGDRKTKANFFFGEWVSNYHSGSVYGFASLMGAGRILEWACNCVWAKEELQSFYIRKTVQKWVYVYEPATANIG